jgi:hypothetical protein
LESVSYDAPHWQEWEGARCHPAIVAWSIGHINLDDQGHWADALQMVRLMGVEAREVWLAHGLVGYDEADTPFCVDPSPAWYELFPATFVAVENVWYRN